MENKTKVTEEETKEISDNIHTDAKESLKSDKAYRSGKKIYDIGMLIFCIPMLLNAIRFFMGIELYIGGSFCTSYFNFIYIIPCIIMIVGLAKCVKTAKKYQTEEKSDKTWLVIISVLFALIVILGTAELLHPSYHVYETEEVTASDGRKFTAVKSENVGIFEKENETMPPYYNLDIYDINGIFARKLVSCSTHKGTYEISAEKDGEYRLVVSYLGIKEKYSFDA